MLNKRIYVRKKIGFNIQEKKLLEDFKNNLKLVNLSGVEYYIIYDVFNIEESEFLESKRRVFSEVNTDDVYESIELVDKNYIAVEMLPNQFDLKAKSAKECMTLLNPLTNCEIKTGELLIFNGISDKDVGKIKDYYINEIESKEKDLNKLEIVKQNFDLKEEILTDFRKLNEEQLKNLLEEKGLSLSFENLKYCQNYFIKEQRDPILGELKVIDTYWSDHCRHTTFNTVLENLNIEDEDVKEVFEEYLQLKEKVSKDKPVTLMDLGTIYGKYAKKNGLLTNLEVTSEDNAISLEIEENGEKFLYQFKNETHNHPTEIEPFGGASTCIGGAIRDPLSGRAYVYQGLRISGCSNILEDVDDTLKGKLPQRVISKKSALGFSSYGNQIGLATTYVKELYHEGYKAKHLEAGAVVGIAKKDNVLRENPTVGDIVLLLGGKTGFDGIGGATGSSKSHKKDSLLTAAVEVQKGNAPEERKIQRLFRNPEVLKLIKKCNDFGAGGVSVAIGELNPSIEIYLDKIPLKVPALKPSDIALSESQERMAVVIAKEDKEKFVSRALEENLEAVEVAKITSDNRLKMFYNDEIIINIDRTFLDSNGVTNYQNVKIEKFISNNLKHSSSLRECFENANLVDNKSLDTMFDSTVGGTTVLMPYGGKYEATKEQVSVQKIPLMDNTTSHVAYGFNPYLMENNPFEGSQEAIIDSIFKLVTSGVELKNINLSFQEYFQRLDMNEKRYGIVVATLLGALKAQKEFNTPALGGKDSMSGTYENLHVPPTLISFAFGISSVDKVISNTIRDKKQYIYMIESERLNYCSLRNTISEYEKLLVNKKVLSASHVGDFGLGLAITKMLMGNKLGCEVNVDKDLYKPMYGTIVFTSEEELDFLKLGSVNDSKIIKINTEEERIEDLIQLNDKYFSEVYPPLEQKSIEPNNIRHTTKKRKYKQTKTKNPKVFIPIFPGTNSEYELKYAFEREGFLVKEGIFKNINNLVLEESIDQFVSLIKESDVIAIPGGFSGSDEPDGSGKYIVNVLTNSKVKKVIEEHLRQDKLILGICNGFQALIKSGLIVNGEVGNVKKEDATLFRNDCNYHISKVVKTKVMTNNSPWLENLDLDCEFSQVVSHGEGKISGDINVVRKLFENDQVAFCYSGENPNGSVLGIEGLVSPCGKVLGKMAHSERYLGGLYLNIEGEKNLNIFKNAYNYFVNKQ